MVQFPQSRFRTLCIQIRMTDSRPPGYPIRLSADLRMCAPTRSFSQLTTAFFASIRQDIHHKPYFHLTILLFALLNPMPALPLRCLANYSFPLLGSYPLSKIVVIHIQEYILWARIELNY